MTIVNMHRLGESFVEKVIDVRRRVTADGKAAAPGESLEFLALIQGHAPCLSGRRPSSAVHHFGHGAQIAHYQLTLVSWSPLELTAASLCPRRSPPWGKPTANLLRQPLSFFAVHLLT